MGMMGLHVQDGNDGFHGHNKTNVTILGLATIFMLIAYPQCLIYNTCIRTCYVSVCYTSIYSDVYVQAYIQINIPHLYCSGEGACVFQ
jgi:hypothetical protein